MNAVQQGIKIETSIARNDNFTVDHTFCRAVLLGQVPQLQGK